MNHLKLYQYSCQLQNYDKLLFCFCFVVHNQLISEDLQLFENSINDNWLMDVAQLEREGKEGVRVQLSYEAKKKGHKLRCLLLGRIFFLKFVCYEVIVKQQIYRRSSSHYCEDLGLGFCLCGIYNVYTHACVYICVMYMLRAQGLGVRVGFTYACVRVCIDACMYVDVYLCRFW